MSDDTWKDGFRELVKTHEAQKAELQSRIADLERQVAAGEANVDTMHKAMTEARDDYHGRAVLFSSRYLDCLDREPIADVVRVTVGPGGILLTPKESVMTHGTDTAFEYVMRVEEGEYHLVRLKGVNRD